MTDVIANIYISGGKILAKLYTAIWSSNIQHISWFDHRFDFLRGPANWYWTERGIYAREAIKPGGAVLEIGCGDGIYADYFYSGKAGWVDAVDKDTKAIGFANRNHQRANIRFLEGDAATIKFPQRKYDTVCMYEVIEHFSPEDGKRMLSKIGGYLAKGGKLAGSTPLMTDRKMHNWEHQNEFFFQDQLVKFLGSVFGKVSVKTSRWPDRMTAYFVCEQPK